MKEDEKKKKIEIQNDNCLIYLKNNELTLMDKSKRSYRDEIIYDDDMKELSFSISNVSELQSNKRKINLKKNFNTIEKTENEISNISIFNSNIKQEETTPKTPLFEINNELNNKSNLSNKKEKNTQNFMETLKSKKMIIKKLNFDTAECDTIQETDTIKKLENKKENKDNDEKKDLNNENININLHKQFFSQNDVENIDNNIIKTEINKNLNQSSENNLKNNKEENINDNDTLDDSLSRRKNRFKLKMNSENIINIKNELIETIKYKEECVEKYNNQIKKSKSNSKTIIHNNIYDLRCRSFSRKNEKKENIEILYTYPKQINLKENLINNKNIDNKSIKTNFNKNNINEINIYKKNLKSRNNSFIKKCGILNWPSEKMLFNKYKINLKNYLNIDKPTSFLYNNTKNNNIFSSGINNYAINNHNYENNINLNNNDFNSKIFSCSSTKNIFIKKNAFVYNNYIHRNHFKTKKSLKKTNVFNKWNN